MDNSSGSQQPPAIPESSANRVSDDFAALREDIANLASSVKSMATEQIGSSVEELQEGLEVQIRRNPTQSVLIAAGIGAVFALILTR